MTNQEALVNLKRVFDTALKSGLIPSVQDAEALIHTFAHIKTELDVADTYRNKQLQPADYYPEPNVGPEEARIPQRTHFRQPEHLSTATPVV